LGCGAGQAAALYSKIRAYALLFLQKHLRVAGFIVDLLTPEAVTNVITRGLDRGTGEIKERSDLPLLPNAL